jgi:hypothetical protein
MTPVKAKNAGMCCLCASPIYVGTFIVMIQAEDIQGLGREITRAAHASCYIDAHDAHKGDDE